MYEILYIYWHLLHGSTFNLCNQVAVLHQCFHSPAPLFETLKLNRQHITQSSRRFAPLLFSAEVNWGSIFTTPTPPGGSPRWCLPGCLSGCLPLPLSTCHLRLPARSTGYRLSSAVTGYSHRLPPAAYRLLSAVYRHQPPATSRSHQPPATSHQPAALPRTGPDCHQLQQAADKIGADTAGSRVKRRIKNPGCVRDSVRLKMDI